MGVVSVGDLNLGKLFLRVSFNYRVLFLWLVDVDERDFCVWFWVVFFVGYFM